MTVQPPIPPPTKDIDEDQTNFMRKVLFHDHLNETQKVDILKEWIGES